MANKTVMNSTGPFPSTMMDFLFFFKGSSSSLGQKRRHLFLPTVYHGFAVFASSLERHVKNLNVTIRSPFGNTVISTRLINGSYPDTRNIVPKTFNYYLEVNAREFLSAMDRVSLFGGVIKLIMTEDEVEMISRSTIAGSANVKLSTFQFSGERLEISFNSVFVSDAIRAVGSEDVTISLIGEMKPFVVKNVKDDSIDMLVTPLRS